MQATHAYTAFRNFALNRSVALEHVFFSSFPIRDAGQFGHDMHLDHRETLEKLKLQACSYCCRRIYYLLESQDVSPI